MEAKDHTTMATDEYDELEISKDPGIRKKIGDGKNPAE